MKIKDIITEAFDKPRQLDWDKDDFDNYNAFALLSDGSPLHIKFEPSGKKEDNGWHVFFNRNLKYLITGQGLQQQVFATVLAAVKQFVEKYKPGFIEFSANKDVGDRDGDRDERKAQSKANLYNSLIKRYAAALGYTSHIDDSDDQVVYTLTRIEKQPVSESTSGKTGGGYTWRFEPGREVPFKTDVDTNTFIRVKDSKGHTVAGVWANVDGNSIEVEYSQVFDEQLRGRGLYTDLLKSLSKHYDITSDTDTNNAAASIYKRLGADYDARQAKHTLRNQGVEEGRKKKKKKTSRSLGRYFFPGYGYYGSGETGEGGGGEGVAEEWSQKYKSSINCSHPKGFSQKAHCAGKKKHNESIEIEMTCPDCGMCQTHGDHQNNNLDEACWKGYHKEGNKKMFGKTYPNCVKNTNEDHQECPECGGPMFSEELINEKRDACYYKVKSRYKVWPSAYASGALVQCRKKGASNWGTKSESSILEGIEQVDENLHKWFKEKWVRFGPDGKIRGDCARGDDSEGKPKCLPQSKAQNLGKKGRASAASRKRREDPNPERHGKAINVATKKKTS
jgi:hypothetical protein